MIPWTFTIKTVDEWIERLMKTAVANTSGAFCLTEADVGQICQTTQDVFVSQPILLELDAPVTICGDIHGQFTDLLRIFEWGGLPPMSSYVFLGDYVDRGHQSLETICLLFCWKIKFPEQIHLLRGNHEAISVNLQYGFYEECKRKLSVKVWKAFNTVFQFLPVAAVIEDRIICMHGGLSPELVHVSAIKSIKRPTDIRNEGLLTDLMWSDPSKEHNYFVKNEDRGIGQWFGKEAVFSFLDRNRLDLICRSHQCMEDGYRFEFDMRLVTIFSAMNYCGTFDNSAAIMIIDEDLSCSLHIFRPFERHERLGAIKRLETLKQEMAKFKNEAPFEVPHVTVQATPVLLVPEMPAFKDGQEAENVLEGLSPFEKEDQKSVILAGGNESQQLEKRRATGVCDLWKKD